MFDVDELQDLANAAVEDIFGRECSYVPPGGGAAVLFTADFQLAPKAVGVDEADFSSYDPRIDVRKSHLVDLGLTLAQHGLVTVAGQTYKVVDVQQSAPGSVVAVLGRSSS